MDTSDPIVLSSKGFNQQGRTHMPSLTKVSADYEDGIITLKIEKYTGYIRTYIYDRDGNIAGYVYSYISGNGLVTIDIANPIRGNYSLIIALDNKEYTGKFYI